MTLRLSIENVDRLPDGGPIRIEVKGRGLDIGRDAHLDWTLPDPSRHISSKHCEIRFQDGEYWLHDVSTNGTFVNGSQFRPAGPYRLRNGDRLAIGQYIVAVEVAGAAQSAGAAAAPAPFVAPAAPADVWGAVGDVAAPDDRSAYSSRAPRAAHADFLDFAAPLAPTAPISDAFAAPAAPDDSWLAALPAATPAPPPVAAPPVMPQPVRPAAPAAARAEAPPAPSPAVPRVEPPPARPAAADDAVLSRIAAAAGIPERALAGRDPLALADEIGTALRLTVAHLAQLLASRAETKSAIRSSSRTMIQALENNPLKFASGPDEALALMFGPPTRNYLGAAATLEQGFADLKSHQMLTFGAMQAALEGLSEDFAPDKIDRTVEADRGLGAIVGSRKAKLWDAYVERWRAVTKRSDGRLNDAFMTLFAQAYDRLQGRGQAAGRDNG